jgi:biotin transport system permease protein
VIGLYVPGDSPLHRARAGLKLAVLAVLLLVVSLVPSPWVLGAGLALLVAASAVSGVGAPAVLGQLRPLLWVLVFVVAVQIWLAGPLAAGRVAASLVLAVGAAGLVTLTTRTQELLDALVTALRPLRHLGVDPDRAGLVLALAVRAVPVLAGLAAEVRQARMARGADRSVRAFAVPLVIRSLRYADRLGEALAARGVDD